MSFRLAPMSRDLFVMTVVLLLLPVVFFFAGALVPTLVAATLSGTGVLMAALYAVVWLFFRPTRFDLDGAALRIVWPLRQRAIARGDIEGARVLTGADFRREHGYGMRIGAGGLWGGFGLLKTGKTTFSMWISRTDWLVVVDVRGERPLLLTPEDPERFVAALVRS